MHSPGAGVSPSVNIEITLQSQEIMVASVMPSIYSSIWELNCQLISPLGGLSGTIIHSPAAKLGGINFDMLPAILYLQRVL